MRPINMYGPHGHCVVPGGKSLLLTVMFEMLIAYLVMLFVLLEHLQELPEK
jgi:hypothetical protein